MMVAIMLVTVQMSNGQQQHIIMNSPPAPGVYEATESIALLPGFSFTATQANSLTLKIFDPCNTGNPAQDFTCRMNHIFQYVNKSRIATGLLSDYGLQMAEPVYFNGILGDSNFVDMDTWRMLYSGMFTSKINNNVNLTAPETIFDLIENATHTDATPVAMMHYQYNMLREDALSQNLMQIVNRNEINVYNFITASK